MKYISPFCVIYSEDKLTQSLGEIYMIGFDCCKCEHSYRVPDQYAGKRVRCKECGEINLIPSAEVEKVGCGDSVANLNGLLQELSEFEKQAPALGIEY